jgi:hypothetical protein
MPIKQLCQIPSLCKQLGAWKNCEIKFKPKGLFFPKNNGAVSGAAVGVVGVLW